MSSPAVYVHGGVSGTPKPTLPRLDHAIRAAADSATALDAVEAAVRALEDDPNLNAAWGAVLDKEGALELDAGVAASTDGPDGSTRCAGVANVRVRHPISLARAVMEQTPHVLLTGEGASRVARALAMEELQDTTPEQRRRYERARITGGFDSNTYGAPEHVDTVGAVALDHAGGLAAGSSTGGVFGKLPGRVGDAPIFGAGYYVSSRCAVVGTGVGEVFMRSLACLRVAQLISAGSDPQSSCEAIIAELGAHEESAAAGLLALDAQGTVGAAYRGGSWAVEGSSGSLEVVKVD